MYRGHNQGQPAVIAGYINHMMTHHAPYYACMCVFSFVRCSPSHSFSVLKHLLIRVELLTWPHFSANKIVQSPLDESKHIMFAACVEALRDGVVGVLRPIVPEYR